MKDLDLTLKQADQIRADFSKFMELTHSRLMFIFPGKIPESLLPYPKSVIYKALEICLDCFEKEGNQKAVETVKSAAVFLLFYDKDEISIKNAREYFNRRSFLKSFLPSLKAQQTEQFKYLINNY